jgi:predicted nucleotidyltransferase
VQKVNYPEFRRLITFADQDKRIQALFLIGSYGTSHYNALSDLDFAVLTREVLSVSEQLAFSAAFSDILKDDRVDLVFLNSSSLALQYKILEDGQLLYSRDDVFLADFVEIVNKRYCDFSIFLNQFYKDYDYGLRKEFL